MAEFPGSTWIVLQGYTKKVNLLTIGYKYNKKSIMTFVLSEGSGSTVARWIYQANFSDEHGNVHTRDVPRPKVLNTYFNLCGLVNSHNHAHQVAWSWKSAW